MASSNGNDFPASGSDQQTVFSNAADDRVARVKICPRCGKRVSASNFARHQKSRSCSNAAVITANDETVVSIAADDARAMICPRCGKQVSTSNFARHQKSRSCSNATTANYETVVSNAADDARVKICPRCDKQMSASNFARHQKSKSCFNATTANYETVVSNAADDPDAREMICPRCGKRVSVSNFAKHIKSKKHKQRSRLHKPSTDYVRVKICPRCGKQVSAANFARHQKSKSCADSATSTNRIEPQSQSAQTALNVSSSKEACEKCGIVVFATNIARHQKSKKCMKLPNKVQPSTSMQSAPKAKMDWICGTFIEQSHWARHIKSKKHKQRSRLYENEPSADSKIKAETRKDYLNAPRLPAPTDIAKLTEKYPKRTIERKRIIRNTDDDVSELATTRRRTLPLNPSVYSKKSSHPLPPLPEDKERPNDDLVLSDDSDYEWVSVMHPTNPLKLTLYRKKPSVPVTAPLTQNQTIEEILNEFADNYDYEKVQQAFDDFDLSFFDDSEVIDLGTPPHTEEIIDLCTPPANDTLPEEIIDLRTPPQTEPSDVMRILGRKQFDSWPNIDLFSSPQQKVHPESSQIRQIMGPPPFEPPMPSPNSTLDFLNSPTYQSPLHFPESPEYSALSPTDRVNNDSLETSQPSPSADAPFTSAEIEEVQTAFKNRLKTYEIKNVNGIKDPIKFFARYKQCAIDVIKKEVDMNNLKVNMFFLATYGKVVNGNEITQIMNFKTKNEIIYSTTNLSDYFDTARQSILAEMEDFQANGSQWMLKSLQNLQVRINRYVPLRGSSYIELPKKVQAKRAVINVKNDDQRCFLWAVLASLHPAKDHVDRLKNYTPYEHELDNALKGMEFPVKLDDITKFERRSGISVNVYCYDEKYVIAPLRVCDKELKTHVDLLYVRNQNQTHYCCIKNLSRLVSSQISKRDHKTWLCKRCLLHFGTETLLLKHKEDCENVEAVKITLPTTKDVIRFEDLNCSMKVPFVVYADFECLLSPISTCQQKEGNKSYTNKYQKHEVVSFSYYVVYTNGEYKRPVTYFGTDAAQKFVQMLEEESVAIQELYSSKNIVPMQNLTEEEMRQVATACHICGRSLDGDSVRDHDHLTGKFRGMAHNKCNLKFNKPSFIPVFIHNLSGYDTHLFIKMFGMNNETISLIPNNEENYISYTVRNKNMIALRFVDSLRFMGTSLDKLVKNLSKEQFHHTSKYYSGEQLELVQKKGIYPYDYMDSVEKYNDKSLPCQIAFYNKLNKYHITDDDYNHAQKVWAQFDISNMKEYTLLYNETDVLLLADVMESFRQVCLSTYNLDPAWYYTAPGLAWSAMLKTTNIELEPLTDYDMILMVEKGIRGGISQCSHRHAQANNIYMSDYNPEKPSTYLTYLDANNLYGWAMSQYMPYKDFKWCDSNIDVTNVADDSETGYILEVDLEYPKEIHDCHSDLPLAPEHRVPPGSKQSKLLTTLFDKERYVLHYRNLKLYLNLGLKLKKIHRVISFSQSNWMSSYIDLNTNMRTKAKNDFEKDFFKLMNNSVFGKTMENIRNRVNILLATKEKQIEKWIAKPNFKSRTIFAENLAAVHMGKTQLKFNKPIYVGMSILDISKTLMYDFHYNVIKAKYSENARLLYTDTDSLTYSIVTKDFYNDMKGMIDRFDTSDYPQCNLYDMPRVNKKVLGKMKDEMNGRIMREFVGLRAKMYATDVNEMETLKKSKGVKKSVVEKEITFDDYKRCLMSDTAQHKTMNVIRSYSHDLYSVQSHKVVLSNNDDKRRVLADRITTLPWGHYRIM